LAAVFLPLSGEVPFPQLWKVARKAKHTVAGIVRSPQPVTVVLEFCARDEVIEVVVEKGIAEGPRVVEVRGRPH
jgi:hypothetical protein